ncbi:MAG: VOC family protein [Chloroflexi bacterium]|nr:VOC family protein [Chloroflexota bacterium]
MDVKLHHCFLSVDDHDKALAFYRDTLGFEVRNDVRYGGMRWVTVGPPTQPDINIVLEPPAADPGISPSDREAISDLLAKGILGRLNFSTADLEGTFDRVVASGADVVQEPMDMPYGTRECAFRDPAGNLIRIIQTRG